MIRVNNICSELQFVDCAVLKLDISNGLMGLRTDDNYDLRLKFEPLYDGIISDRLCGRLRLSVDLVVTRDEETDEKVNVSAILEGVFDAEKASMSEDDFKRMVAINGGAALYGMARGKIEAMSGLIFSTGKITLPYVNVLEYYRQAEEGE